MSPRFRSAALVLAFAVTGLSGCMKSTTLVQVRPDGTGKIIEAVGMRPETMRMFAGMLGATAQQQKDLGYLPADQFKKKAPIYGKRVTFASTSRVEKDGFRYTTATYNFRDINLVRLPTNEDMGQGAGAAATNTDFIHFKLAKDPVNPQLSIIMPPPKPEENKPDENKPDAAKPDAAQQDQADPQQEAMLKQIFADMEVTVAVECGSAITQSNAQYRNDNRITLLHLNFGKLLDQKDKFKEIAKKGEPKDLHEAQEWFKGIDGFEFESNPVVTARFH